MDRKSDNDGGTSDFEMPLFDLESQRLEFDTSSETDSSSVFDCNLDESFQQIKNDLERLHRSTPKKTSFYRTPTACPDESSTVVDDEFPEIDIDQRFDVMKDRVRNYRSKETETLRRCIIEINNTIACVIDNEGMVKKCERLELDISKQEKIQLLKTDIAAIKSRLMSFMRIERLDSNIQNKNELQALIHTAKTELSSLDTYWNSRNIVSITEELNRHFNELNNSNTVLNHMNKEIADLYSIYTNTRQRLESEILRYQNALITWAECDKQLMELEMKFKGFGDNGIVCGNQKSGCFGSASDSGMSDSGSEHELNEHEKRLVNLKQLANNLMTIMTPGSEALSSILARIENNEKQLKELQQTCKDLIGRSELCIDDDKLDNCDSLVNTDIVDADVAAEEPIAETPVNSNARFRRMSWIAGTFYLIVMILWSVDWLEPQCCDLQNNYKWSFALGLRYINGPPPT
ncbi:unnamed protein product [Macrosiphum euphorbiae]|uniref:KASH domain-containing protein n=1 Tax=Macrosiphum euphorbiae TaxID=13131 RepID=A0AAV0WW66_9HEMI|nr:unnamed protein product [Macrosiphum euphorbiae]